MARDDRFIIRTMLRLADDGKPIAVVDDQRGRPTYAKDLAAFLAQLARTPCNGLFHAPNAGSCTWYQFARAIMALSGRDALGDFLRSLEPN